MATTLTINGEQKSFDAPATSPSTGFNPTNNELTAPKNASA